MAVAISVRLLAAFTLFILLQRKIALMIKHGHPPCPLLVLRVDQLFAHYILCHFPLSFSFVRIDTSLCIVDSIKLAVFFISKFLASLGSIHTDINMKSCDQRDDNR